jgi:hypothetical protein
MRTYIFQFIIPSKVIEMQANNVKDALERVSSVMPMDGGRCVRIMRYERVQVPWERK